MDGSLGVDQKALTITANDRTKTYGDTVTFAGTEFTPSGLVNTDSVTSVTLTSAGAAQTATVAGSPYAITASAATGAGLGNYLISYVDGSLGVDPKALTITADNRTKTYGDTVTFAGTEFTPTGLVEHRQRDVGDADERRRDTDRHRRRQPVCDHRLGCDRRRARQLPDQLCGRFAGVDPKASTITADNRTKTYGDTVTFAGTEFTPTGLVNTDSVTSVTLTSAGAAQTATVAGSPYAITASAATGAGLGNYLISYVDGSLGVDPKALDDHRERPHQDLRRHSDVRRHRVHADGLVEHRQRDVGDADQRRRGTDRHRRRQPVCDHRLGCDRRRARQLPDQLCGRFARRRSEGVDDHRTTAPRPTAIR